MEAGGWLSSRSPASLSSAQHGRALEQCAQRRGEDPAPRGLGQLLKGPSPGSPRHGAHLGHGEDRRGQEGSGEDRRGQEGSAGTGWQWRGCGCWAAAPGGHGLHGGMSPTPACV